MSNVFFTSDLHIGNKLCASLRGFASVEEHDATIIQNINDTVSKRNKLYILGDLVFGKENIHKLGEIVCGNVVAVLGNHDKFKALDYLRYVNDVAGFVSYKKFFLSHCPIALQEIYRVRGNIHGHIHRGAATKPLYPRWYFNVNVDFHDYRPVCFTEIDEHFRRQEDIDGLRGEEWHRNLFNENQN
jgi:calcineurin-like phosphoesterase family protein